MKHRNFNRTSSFLEKSGTQEARAAALWVRNEVKPGPILVEIISAPSLNHFIPLSSFFFHSCIKVIFNPIIWVPEGTEGLKQKLGLGLEMEVPGVDFREFFGVLGRFFLVAPRR